MGRLIRRICATAGVVLIVAGPVTRGVYDGSTLLGGLLILLAFAAPMLTKEHALPESTESVLDPDAVLAFESRWIDRHPGQKEAAIRATFGVSPARYYQRLTSVSTMPEAHAVYPALCDRLAEQRKRRLAAHSTTTR